MIACHESKGGVSVIGIGVVIRVGVLLSLIDAIRFGFWKFQTQQQEYKDPVFHIRRVNTCFEANVEVVTLSLHKYLQKVIQTHGR